MAMDAVDGASWIWRNRRHAGDQLAACLAPQVHHHQDTTVVGIPPGGLEVAAALASALQLPLSCWSVQRLRVPDLVEEPIGAIAPGNIQIFDEVLLARLGLDAEQCHAIVRRHMQRMERDQRRFGDPGPADLSHRRLILVDEGIRSGMAMLAALRSLRSLYPISITVAAPVGSRPALEQLDPQADGLVVLRPVERLRRLSDWFASLPTLREREVLALLASP
jgi:putative phosphoribosyl transferase